MASTSSTPTAASDAIPTKAQAEALRQLIDGSGGWEHSSVFRHKLARSTERVLYAAEWVRNRSTYVVEVTDDGRAALKRYDGRQSAATR